MSYYQNNFKRDFKDHVSQEIENLNEESYGLFSFFVNFLIEFVLNFY